MTTEKQSQLKLLIAHGKSKGYLTYAEVNDTLPDDIVDPEQIEDIINMINDMGITVHETAPDEDTLLLSENSVNDDDDDDADEAAATMAALDPPAASRRAPRAQMRCAAKMRCASKIRSLGHSVPRRCAAQPTPKRRK